MKRYEGIFLLIGMLAITHLFTLLLIGDYGYQELQTQLSGHIASQEMFMGDVSYQLQVLSDKCK